ncbi:MAG: sensor domain-containing diguanylate cyclase [Chloroflexi bacterium]|nr:sensor domain-containing diguanylate cyclase [Chloroflexota bacterium]
MLIKMGELLKRCLTLEDVFSVFAQYGGEFFPQSAGGLYIFDPETGLSDLVAQWGKGLTKQMVFTFEDCCAIRQNLPCIEVFQPEEMRCEHVRMAMEEGGFTPYICAPLNYQGEVLGLLHLRFESADALKEHVNLAVVLADLLTLVMINMRMREQLELQTVIDPLTGLFNRRYLLETINRNIFHPERREYPVSVLKIDIDGFRMINDQYGFAAGDAILRSIGEFLKGHVRGSDIACRYGGEEFVIILPGLPQEAALKRVEWLRAEVKKLRVRYQGNQLPALTFSIGVALFPQNGSNMADVLKSANTAMLNAKLQGYDQYALAD